MQGVVGLECRLASQKLWAWQDSQRVVQSRGAPRCDHSLRKREREEWAVMEAVLLGTSQGAMQSERIVEWMMV